MPVVMRHVGASCRPLPAAGPWRWGSLTWHHKVAVTNQAASAPGSGWAPLPWTKGHRLPPGGALPRGFKPGRIHRSGPCSVLPRPRAWLMLKDAPEPTFASARPFQGSAGRHHLQEVKPGSHLRPLSSQRGKNCSGSKAPMEQPLPGSALREHHGEEAKVDPGQDEGREAVLRESPWAPGTWHTCSYPHGTTGLVPALLWQDWGVRAGCRGGSCSCAHPALAPGPCRWRPCSTWEDPVPLPARGSSLTHKALGSGVPSSHPQLMDMEQGQPRHCGATLGSHSPAPPHQA